MKKLLSLLTANLANPVEGIANSLLSLVKDKTRDGDTSFIRENIRKGVSISSKRVLNLIGTSMIVTFALMDMQTNGINKFNLIVLGVGVAYSAIMSFITSWKEK